MGKFLRIRGWAEHFETNETRKYKELRWVKVSNNQNDPGYASLVVQENGAAMLGAWVAILQLASRCKIRGDLVEGNKNAYTIETIALVVRLPIDTIRQTVALLTTKILWMEWVSDPSVLSPGDSAGAPGELPACIGTELNGTEQKFDHIDLVVSRRNGVSTNSGDGAREASFCESEAIADAKKFAAVVQPKKRVDWLLIVKAAILKQTGPISQNAVLDSVEAARIVSGVRNRVGYFRTCLENRAVLERRDLAKMLAGVEVHADLLTECRRPREPRMMEA